MPDRPWSSTRAESSPCQSHAGHSYLRTGSSVCSGPGKHTRFLIFSLYLFLRQGQGGGCTNILMSLSPDCTSDYQRGLYSGNHCSIGHCRRHDRYPLMEVLYDHQRVFLAAACSDLGGQTPLDCLPPLSLSFRCCLKRFLLERGTIYMSVRHIGQSRIL